MAHLVHAQWMREPGYVVHAQVDQLDVARRRPHDELSDRARSEDLTAVSCCEQPCAPFHNVLRVIHAIGTVSLRRVHCYACRSAQMKADVAHRVLHGHGGGQRVRAAFEGCNACSRTARIPEVVSTMRTDRGDERLRVTIYGTGCCVSIQVARANAHVEVRQHERNHAARSAIGR